MSRIKGWCPGALRPMESGDGWIARIRPRGGRIRPAQANAIASAAHRHGNGLIDLTSRANLQIRGIARDSYPTLIAELRDAGLIDRDIGAETRRNVILSPFADARAEELAARLEQLLTECDLELPAKFGFAVDCGAQRVLSDTPADIRIERGETGDLILRADGCETGRALLDVEQALQLARWFLDQRGAPDGRGRMKALIATGARPPGADLRPVPSAAPLSVGPVPQGRLVALEFGQCDGRTLAALARYGSLRMTPWRMLLVPAFDPLPGMSHLIQSPDDPRLRVYACSGGPACPQGHAATRPLARDLAPHLPKGAVLHVSGCSKGCGWPRKADITLTATPSGFFDLVRGGTASDLPEQRGLSPATISKAL
ncbi:precorrin-3B synthase [Paracoccus seriniphilus]|uniref:precorrin-3B synthase n=1 Tax=Paracoccus seriniphilus TaxID=184748 RepID=UPI003565BD72